jgi:lysophospholipase L1-like esterase
MIPFFRHLHGWSATLLCAGLALFDSQGLRGDPQMSEIAGDDSKLLFSDFVHKEVLSEHVVRFDRLLDEGTSGYRWDNPGARVTFRTDAKEVIAHLRYSEKHTSRTARRSVGMFLIDGISNPNWTFKSLSTDPLHVPEQVEVALPVPNSSGYHTYALVMPYGDSVDFCGLTINRSASFESPPPRPALRYLAFGDSITHGFTASHIGLTYSYRLAEQRNWQLINLGLGGRSTHAADGDVIGSLDADIITILIGTNDWQGGVDPKQYRGAISGLLSKLRAHRPRVPVYLMTSLWVSPKWQPAKARFPLEDYRQILRDLLLELKDSNLHLIEGPDLIDHDEKFFDPVLVHPNDAGFSQMAERLAAKIAPISRSKQKH